MQKKKRLFYGWWIVLAGFMLSGVSIGININCNTALMEPVCQGLEISISSFSLSSSISSFAAIPCCLLIPELIHRISVRKYMAVSGIGFVAFKFLFGCSQQLWQLYICALGSGICASGLSYMAVNSLLNNWFYEKNGTVVGIASSGGGMLGAIILPLITWVVSQWGWRAGYMAEAIISAVFVGVSVLVVRDAPGDIGEKPFGYVSHGCGEIEDDGKETGIDRSEAFKQPAFYFLLAGLFLLTIAGMGILPYLMSYLGTLGYNTAFAASVVSLVLIVVTFGKVGMGAAFDAMGLKAANALISFSMIASLLLLGIAEIGQWVSILFALVFGFAYADMSIPAPYLTRRLFGNRDFSSIYGIIMVATSVGGTIGNLLTGIIYERSGSYRMAWFIYCGIMVMVMAFLHLAISSCTEMEVKEK